MKITALKDLPYAGKDRKANETFDADPGDAKILITIGVVKEYKPQPARVSAPRPAKSRSAGGRSSGKRSGYSRRDMRAEK